MSLVGGAQAGHAELASQQYISGPDVNMASFEATNYGSGDDYLLGAAADEQQPPWGQDQGASGQREVEVKVTRILHTFRKDELTFSRSGRTQSSTDDDWERTKREGQRVWVYKHSRTLYWTTKLG